MRFLPAAALAVLVAAPPARAALVLD